MVGGNIHDARPDNMASGVLQLHGHTHILHRTIASGGMAEVILASRHGLTGFDKLVAIKRILPHLLSDQQFVDRFIDEARLAAQLRHPNILEIYDFYNDSNGLYIIMEYLSGESLSFINARCARRGTPLPVPIVCRVAADVATGLDYAYNGPDAEGAPRHLIHRDVSHANIVLTYHGMVKLVDFGVAKATRFDLCNMPATLKGKLGYCAPELLAGAEADTRSDIFSLGIVLHEMLTRRRLFMGDDLEQAVRSIAATTIQPPSAFNKEVPPEFDEVVMAMLERDPTKRVDCAASIRERLEAILEGAGRHMHRTALSTWLQQLVPERFEQRRDVENQARRRARAWTPLGTTRPESRMVHGNVVGSSRVLTGEQLPAESVRSPWLLAVLAAAGTAVVLVLAMVYFWSWAPRQVPPNRSLLPRPPPERAVVVRPPPVRPIGGDEGGDASVSAATRDDANPPDRRRRTHRRRSQRKATSARAPTPPRASSSSDTLREQAERGPEPPAPPPPPPELGRQGPDAVPAPAQQSATAKPDWGTLHVLSDIRGHVFIDGHKTDLKTPAKLKLPPGEHDIVLLIQDGNVRRIGQRVTITAGKTTQMRFTGER